MVGYLWNTCDKNFIWVVADNENGIAYCKLVDTEHTKCHLQLNRLHLYQLTSTSSRAEVGPSIVQQVVVVVVEQP